MLRRLRALLDSSWFTERNGMIAGKLCLCVGFKSHIFSVSSDGSVRFIQCTVTQNSLGLIVNFKRISKHSYSDKKYPWSSFIKYNHIYDPFLIYLLALAIQMQICVSTLQQFSLIHPLHPYCVFYLIPVSLWMNAHSCHCFSVALTYFVVTVIMSRDYASESCAFARRKAVRLPVVRLWMEVCSLRRTDASLPQAHRHPSVPLCSVFEVILALWPPSAAHATTRRQRRFVSALPWRKWWWWRRRWWWWRWEDDDGLNTIAIIPWLLPYWNREAHL